MGGAAPSCIPVGSRVAAREGLTAEFSSNDEKIPEALKATKLGQGPMDGGPGPLQ